MISNLRELYGELFTTIVVNFLGFAWGLVYSNKDGIIEISGVSDVVGGEMAACGGTCTVLGFVASLRREFVKLIIVGNNKKVYDGSSHCFTKTNTSFLGGNFKMQAIPQKI